MTAEAEAGSPPVRLLRWATAVLPTARPWQWPKNLLVFAAPLAGTATRLIKAAAPETDPSTTALLSAGDDAVLRELARGDVTAALTVGFEALPGAAFPLTARVSGPKPADGRDGVTRLRGHIRGVRAELRFQ